MPRQSAASLATVAFATPRKTEPPSHLPEDQAALWRQIAHGLPARWFDGGNLHLLEVMTQHMIFARRLAAKIETQGATHIKSAPLQRLLAMHSAQIVSLSTKMRLTQQATYRPQQAGNQRAAHVDTSTPKPWDPAAWATNEPRPQEPKPWDPEAWAADDAKPQ